MKFLIINGPNVNMLRFTDPDVAGEMDYDILMDYVQRCCAQMDIETEFYQSNHEGDLVDEIQSAHGRADGIIINAAGYAQYSVAILDALQMCGVPAVEVVFKAPSKREPFRQNDVVSFGCQGHFVGEGIMGYIHAAEYLAQLLRLDATPGPHIAM